MFGNNPAPNPSRAGMEVALGRVVTPMLDMTFQMLFFFVMQFRPLYLEGQIDFQLPDTDGLREIKPPEAPAPDRDEYRLTIVAKSGLPEVMTWSSRTGAAETIPVGEQLPQTIQALEAKLQTIARPRRGEDELAPLIKIEADKKLRYAVLVVIMDTCKRAGFNDVSVMPLPRVKN
jgi:biopolymer transport protein ExbD